MALNVRPYKVIEAAKWLISNSSLHRNEGIAFDNDHDWLNKYNLEIAQRK